ncbi:MAG: nucleotide pyrophosphohydrolase [Clostridia bacterium]|nr:nucleotide pyrophosphohydrolase [Clostridia bacterium]
MQQKVKSFNDINTREALPVYARLLDTASELGELAKEYLKSSDYGTQEFEINDDFKLEFGDVLYCLMSLANEVGIDAEEQLEKVLVKYQARIDKKKSMGSEN